MARKNMLSGFAIKALKNKPSEKLRRHLDGRGLFFVVSPAGETWFEFRFRYQGKDKTLNLGRYPTTSLAEAREKHQIAKEQLKGNLNPAAVKQAAIQEEKMVGITLEEIAQQWLDKREPGWSPKYKKDIHQKLNCYILQRFGNKPIIEIGRREVKEVLYTFDAKGNIPTLKKVRRIIGQIFQFAINHEILGVKEDPTLYLRNKGMFTSHIVRHRAALTEPREIGALMRSIESYGNSELRTKVQTALALKFSALTFYRPGEISKAEWAEIDLNTQLWRIPAKKMKMHRDHLIPLAKQTLELLDRLKLITGHCIYLFPNERTEFRPMSAETVNAALRRMGFSREEMTSHGFRGMASTRLNEQGWNSDWIELQLAHSEKNGIRSAYNSVLYLDGRREMMQWWADYLEKLRDEITDLIPPYTNIIVSY
jgi:integrase